jgi:hypothetical protein
LRIDVGDAAPGFESLIYTTLNSAFDKFRYIFDSNTGTYWYYPEDVKWLEHGNRWPEIPSYKNQRFALMDFSYPSSGKLIAMDYMYYEFSTQDANAVGDRSIV